MCGVCGFVDTGGARGCEELTGIALRMAERLAHRGPDGLGAVADPSAGVALGHRRLAVIDLSAEGAQPMRSQDARYELAFNGEIYNFEALRGELERAGSGGWRGHSDTEVLLEALALWGVERTLPRLNGMFGFALWDRRERVLVLARDRAGEKPLYYGWSGGVFLFGSELKALQGHPNWSGTVDRSALGEFLARGYIPAPASIYEGIAKLPPATSLTLRFDGGRPTAEPVAYWSMRGAVERGRREPFRGDAAEATDRLDELLRAAVRLRMISDVPLGAFLSGGVDSSTIVGMMQAQSARPVNTFTIGFHEPGYDEAGVAAQVARHLGTQHREWYITPHEAREALPRIPELFDEPFGDPSQLPTYLLASLARRHVTVALSGDGGDELFLGYGRYAAALRLWSVLGRVPLAARRLAAGVLEQTPVGALDSTLGWLAPALNHYGRRGRVGDRLRKLAGPLRARSPEELYLRLLTQFGGARNLALGASRPAGLPGEPGPLSNFAVWMGYYDAATYLPDNILVKLDRASMAVSLEGRVPMLDPTVMEFAWSLPLELKMRRGTGKWLLREVLHRYVPPALVEGPKRGFGVPIAEWLRGPLRGWAADLLDPAMVRGQGLLDADPIQALWQEHLDERRNWSYTLWNLLAFQAWLLARGPAGS